MEDYDMPLFDIKIAKTHMFVSGGGGNKDYGVDNGIFAVDKLSGEKCVYNTEDILLKLEVVQFQKNSHEENKDKKENNSKCPKYLIAACGNDFFYLFTFDGKFTLVSKHPLKVKKAVINQHLYILCKSKKVYAFANILENPKIEIEESEGSVNLSDYAFEILIKDKQAVFEVEKDENDNNKENSSFVAIGNVSNFFVSENKLHVIRYEENTSIYSIDGEMESAEGKIKDIFYKNENLIFYSHTPEGSILNINGNEKKLPKITDMSISGEYLAVSTVYGDIHVFFRGEEAHKENVADMAITGVGIYNQQIKFTMFTGTLGTTELVKNKRKRNLLLLGFFILLLAIILGSYIKNKKK